MERSQGTLQLELRLKAFLTGEAKSSLGWWSDRGLMIILHIPIRHILSSHMKTTAMELVIAPPRFR